MLIWGEGTGDATHRMSLRAHLPINFVIKLSSESVFLVARAGGCDKFDKKTKDGESQTVTNTTVRTLLFSATIIIIAIDGVLSSGPISRAEI